RRRCWSQRCSSLVRRLATAVVSLPPGERRKAEEGTFRLSPLPSAGLEPHLCRGLLGPPASSRSRREAGKDAGGPRPCAFLQSNLAETALGYYLIGDPRAVLRASDIFFRDSQVDDSNQDG